MEYRPCIDIHNGKVKQIVGASLRQEGDYAKENFVSERDADFFAQFYKEQNLYGGHVIMLNSPDSPYYDKTKEQALLALRTFPEGLMIGGGVTADNAEEFLDAGASHIILTSYVFHDGVVDYERLQNLYHRFGRDRIVLDLSCKKREESYFVVTDRWTTFTDAEVNLRLLSELAEYGSEFLIHAVDIEGKSSGVDEELITMLAEWDGIPITYAGGVGSYDDILKVKELGFGKINLTVGSALDLFGGPLNYETVLGYFSEV